MSDALELRNVSMVYGTGAAEVHALRSIDLTVRSGELVAIMGPSGSGKSTLLTIAGTLEEPTSGDVIIGGTATTTLKRDDTARMRRREIGYVFQHYNLLPGLTAVENVAMPLELDGVGAKDACAQAMSVLESLELADRAAHFPDDLSGGEAQRVAIARAVVGERHLVLADEPTGALDSVSGEIVMRMLRSACKRRKKGEVAMAGVVVTHDAQLASWADRIVFIRDGQIVDRTDAQPGPESLLEEAGTGRRRRAR